MQQRFAKPLNGLVTFVVALAMLMFGSVALAGTHNHPGNGNTTGTLSFNSPSPSVGQQVICTFSSGFKKTQPINLRFTDETTGSDHSQTNATITYENGDYQFTMPALVQGHAYDVTATIDGTTYELVGFVCPVDPGHQLPETRYAILFPLALLAMLIWHRRQSKRRIPAARSSH